MEQEDATNGSADQSIERIRIDTEPRRLMVTSEPYVVLTQLGYQAAIRVYERKRRREYEMLIGAKSLAQPLSTLVGSNRGKFAGVDFWVRKKDETRTSAYVVEE